MIFKAQMQPFKSDIHHLRTEDALHDFQRFYSIVTAFLLGNFWGIRLCLFKLFSSPLFSKQNLFLQAKKPKRMPLLVGNTPAVGDIWTLDYWYDALIDIAARAK